MLQNSFTIGKILGIPIRLHISFLVALPLFIYFFSFAPQIFGPTGSGIVPFIAGFVLTVLFFSTLVLHELAHSWVAMRHGIKIRSITLFVLGGASAMEDIPRDPAVELRMAAAGPLTSLIIGIFLVVIFFYVFPGRTIINAVFGWLGVANIFLGSFNLFLPAFPMDGGRVLRGFLAEHMSYVRATGIAATVGRVLAIALGFFGILMGIRGILLIGIAFFVYIGASQEEAATLVSLSLQGIKVRDLMTKRVVTIDPKMNVDTFVELIKNEKHESYPVVADHKLQGVAEIEEAAKVTPELRSRVLVEDIMDRDFVAVREDDEVEKTTKLMQEFDKPSILVTDNGNLKGIVSEADIVRVLHIKKALA